MQKMRKTLFISDLHLEENRPEITSQFISLLNQCDASVDALYILGDLFEAWIGDDNDTPFHRKIMHALKEASKQGLRIYFMHGNRDFLIGKKFLRETGCTLLSDEEKILLYDTPVLLMHGDTLCTKDHAYLKARKLGHNRFLQCLFLLMPLSSRRKFADKMRAKSARHTQSAPKEIMDVTPEEVDRVMLKHGVKHLIHGHTHRPQTHHFTLNGHPATRMVLGAWHDQGNAIVWYENGERELYNFCD
jgi:UDP-2,3-diacylglucosamine hydrolase